MAQITATMVKTLREQTGQGMMECKKALAETDGDVQAAQDLLRSRGMAKAEKKAARATSEGLIDIRVSEDQTEATLVEVSCETDFCSRNDVFRAMVSRVADLAAQSEAGEISASEEISSTVQGAFNKIGENMGYVRGVKISGTQVGAYKHHNNKVAVAIALEGKADPTIVSEICMHIAFHAPMGIRPEDIPADVLEHEKAIAKAQAIEQGKPEEIAEKMVVGKVKKFIEQNCLLEQPFVKDETKKIKEVLGDATVKAFVRYELGETANAEPEGV